MKPERVNILGVPVDCVTMQSAVEFADQVIQEKSSAAILAINPEKVMHCRSTPEFLKLIEQTELLIPDGIGVVIAARLSGKKEISRVPGAELMPKLCKLAADKGYSIFLYGASPEVNELTELELQKRYPTIKIAGRQHGYLKDEDMPEFIEKLKQLKPDMLFAALGSPKQEQWINTYQKEAGIAICQGVGGTFDVICGKVKRAPKLFRMLHLEWFYRLATNPKRLMRQTALPRFVWHFMLSLIKK